MLLVLAYVVHSSVAVGVFWLWYIIRRSFVGLVSCVGVLVAWVYIKSLKFRSNCTVVSGRRRE